MNRFSSWSSSLGSSSKPSRGGSILTPLAIGVGSALMASPCTSPILGTVLATLAESATFSRGLFLMGCYGAGISVLFVAIGVGLLAAEKMPRSGRWMVYVHKFSGILILVTGVYYLYKGFGGV